jgi:hypothetical protein
MRGPDEFKNLSRRASQMRAGTVEDKQAACADANREGIAKAGHGEEAQGRKPEKGLKPVDEKTA